jgi:hypothetical protein
VGAARVEILQETRQTGAYRIHLPPASRWRAPSNIALQLVAGRVLVGGEEFRPRTVLDPADRWLETPDEVPACLLAICQPPLAPVSPQRT